MAGHLVGEGNEAEHFVIKGRGDAIVVECRGTCWASTITPSLPSIALAQTVKSLALRRKTDRTEFARVRWGGVALRLHQTSLGPSWASR